MFNNTSKKNIRKNCTVWKIFRKTTYFWNSFFKRCIPCLYWRGEHINLATSIYRGESHLLNRLDLCWNSSIKGYLPKKFQTSYFAKAKSPSISLSLNININSKKYPMKECVFCGPKSRYLYNGKGKWKVTQLIRGKDSTQVGWIRW